MEARKSGAGRIPNSGTLATEKTSISSRTLTDFVEHVDARHIYTISFDRIDKLVCGGVASERDVGARHSVLFAYRLDGILVQVRHANRSADVDSALFLLLESNRCRLLV